MAALTFCCAFAQSGVPHFNVKDFGVTGRKADDARQGIQKAIEAAAAAGGGTVYLPAGQYTSGGLELKSHVRLYLESGATLFAKDAEKEFPKGALLFGENLENITIEGRGTIDGQAEYFWATTDHDDAYIRPNQLLMKALGKPLLRAFPKGYPARVHPRMILLLRCKDVRIAGVSILRSPSWAINPYACERLVIDGIYVSSSLKEAVWSDGIDPDGCKDVHISNSTIETGDDALVFYSSNAWGPALPTENVTVSNCRLSSASSALKFCDGNSNAIRKVVVDNVVITNSNRGIAFMVYDGGEVSDVTLSNITIECRRFDWFWWGEADPIHFNIKRRSEVDGQKRENEPGAGKIRNVLIRNVIARGQGTSLINGHPQSWLDGITLENIKLFVSSDLQSPLDKRGDAIQMRWARNVKMRDVEVIWEPQRSGKWSSAISVEDVNRLELEGFSGRQSADGSGAPAIVLRRTQDSTIRNAKFSAGTSTGIQIEGGETRRVVLRGNDFRDTRSAYRADTGVRPEEIDAMANLPPGNARRSERK
jgi:hypothetical protein